MGSVVKKCYRQSHIQTYAVARMLSKNNNRDTWNTQVDAFFCFTKQAKEKFTKHGIDESRLIIKSNFIVYRKRMKGRELLKPDLFESTEYLCLS